MPYYVGTSGYAYKEWKGSFYPAQLPDTEMLPHYAKTFPAVEINNTFYRMPREKNILEWGEQVPDSFRFAIKASQRITHHAQLQNAGELVSYLAETVAVLGIKLGPTLFQLPPHLKKDIPRLAAFLETLPNRWRVAIEFRNKTWFEGDEMFEALRRKDVALCVSDQEELSTPLVATATWGYARLHLKRYEEPALIEWAARLAGQSWEDTFVFFKHDHAPGSGYPVAESLLAKLRS